MTFRLPQFIIFMVLLANTAMAETPAYQILSYPFSNRSAAMGGTKAADPTGTLDVNGNPASLSFVESLQAQIGFVDHLVGIKGFSAASVLPLERHRLGAELIYFDYGLFDGTDIYGNTQGTFGYHELASSLTYAFMFSEKIRMGGRLGRFQRVADSQSSSEFFYDIGATYHSAIDSLTWGISITSLPLGETEETLPGQVRVGTSKILSHLPLRLNLDGIYGFDERWQVAVGGEILLHDQFTMRLGVNSNRFDLQTGVTESDFIAGLSAGFSLHWQGMLIEMAGQSFGAAGWINQLSIAYGF